MKNDIFFTNRPPRINYIKPIRQQKDKTQAELGKELGVAQGTISLWERGMPIKPHYMKRLAEILHVSPTYLFPPQHYPRVSDLYDQENDED